MIELDKVYIVPLNDLKVGVKVFAVTDGVGQGNGSTAYRVATYLLGRNVRLHLICRPGFPSIILTETRHGAMAKEVQQWLDRDSDLLHAAKDALKYLETTLGDDAEENDLLRNAVVKEAERRKSATVPVVDE